MRLFSCLKIIASNREWRRHRKNMKKIQVLLLTILVALGSMAAPKLHDVVILRSGDIFKSKVNQISAKSLIFENYTNGVKSDQYPLSDVYMVKFAKRGNVYFMPDGRRMTGENQPINYKASIIYTVDCKEILAFDIVMELGSISYSKKNRLKKTVIQADTQLMRPMCL